MAPTRDSILKEYRDQILEGMARTLWVSAYADWAEEETPGGMGIAKRPGQGGKPGSGDLVELYGMAQTADLEEDFEFTSDNAMPLLKSDTKAHAEHVDHEWKMNDAYLFGSMLAWMALGAGVSWFDDHKEFELVHPNFECSYDGEDLVWSGGIHDVREVAGKLGKITIVNAGDSDAWARTHTYVFAFGPYGTPLLMAYGDHLESALDACVEWIADNEPDMLMNEQVAEEYNRLIAEGETEDAAIEGSQVDTYQDGQGNYIDSDWRIIAEDPSEDDLQRIAGRKQNPSCSDEYHRELKRDLAKWRRLELKGSQPRRSKPGVLEMRDCDRCHSTLALPVLTGNPRRRNGDLPEVCSEAEHEAMKRDPATWSTLKWKGREVIEADEDGPEEVREYRNCNVCDSTIAKLMTPNPAGLTAKGERMYEDIKRSYQARKDPRAKEIASRTVLARSKEGAAGLVKNAQPGERFEVGWGRFDRATDKYENRRVFDTKAEAYKFQDQLVDDEGGNIESYIHILEPNPPGRLAAAKTKAKTAQKKLDARKAAGFEGGCDDFNCPGWAVFETGRGMGVEVCDMCNSEAKRQGLPVLHDDEVKHLPEAARELRRQMRET